MKDDDSGAISVLQFLSCLLGAVLLCVLALFRMPTRVVLLFDFTRPYYLSCLL
jgi:hypothetical protein